MKGSPRLCAENFKDIMESQSEPRKNPFKEPGILTKIFGVLLVIILTVVCIEGFLWLALPISQERSIQMVRNQSIPGLKKNIYYDKNKYGFRSLSMKTREKPPGVFRIVCLGASTTDQANQSTEDTWSGILETKLRESLGDQGIRVEVAAYGKSGEKAKGRLFWAWEKLLDFHPDLVVTLEGINDLCWGGGPYTGIPERHEYVEPEKETFFKDATQIGRRLLILEHRVNDWKALLTGKAFEWHSRKLPSRRKIYQAATYVENPVRNPDPIREFSDAMTALVKFLTDSNIEVVLMGQPVLWKEGMSEEVMKALWFTVNASQGAVRPGSRWLEKEINRYNNVQKQIAETYKTGYVDMNRKIPKTLEYFFDDCHFTDKGSRKMAEELFPVVKQRMEKILLERKKKKENPLREKNIEAVTEGRF